MLKNILSLVLCLLVIQVAKAAKPDSLVVYLKNSGQKVDLKDSADYYRVILPPDTNIDRDLYRIYEYYFNGKAKGVATSFTQPVNLVLDGTSIEYFIDGKRKRTCRYKNGRLIDLMTNYYPNGKLYNILKIEDINYWYNDVYFNGFFAHSNYRYKVQVVELRDSTGKVLVTNGTGHALIYDDTFNKLIEEGDLKNNKKEGEWHGLIADSGKFICTFHKDVLKAGVTYLKSGKHYSFKNVSEQSVFSDGPDAFNYFIKKNLQYPESARKHKVAGYILIGFDVETDGRVSNVKVIRGLLKSLDDEAIRVVSLSPPWYPATKFGIPFVTHNSISVNFTNY